MKQIGILTFWNVPNYGAYMQAYSLQKVISERYDNCNAFQISYLNKKHYDVYYSNINKQYPKWYINPRFYFGLLRNGKRKAEVLKTKKFLEYYEMIPHAGTDIKTLKLDYLILGSDIIWDYQVGFFGRDQFLFGIGVNAKKKISYAPSFGTVILGKNVPPYVCKGLGELDCISVRDEKSKNLVKEISGRESTVVLDPTLLWDFSKDKNIVKPPISAPYIIVYGSFFTDELIEGAQKYCKENKLKLICLSSLDDDYEWCDLTINQEHLNPFEWTGYFKHANAVMTCTYHGLMFGLLFKKRIIFNMTEFIMAKAESLIDCMELRDVLVNYKSFESKIKWDWDYSRLGERLNKMREDSFDFLDGVICDE